MRIAKIIRKTTETDITLDLNLDGAGKYCVDTGIGFLDHMLELFARHGQFDLELQCTGDLRVDGHHTAEDAGICLGTAFADALGDRAGITRYGDVTLPMDESLVLAAVDISGRARLEYSVGTLPPKVGEFDTELAEEFWTAFVRCAGIALHIKRLNGTNAHHILEASFKATARALSKAVALDPRLGGEIPSTKGIL
ncbi:MAG: imidazoleglycerol-phosphate dehydratase HisB [Oscillospiraceae bacterium]|jgi:imidazoleglycerol-phosphate dehydratase|nr:imidazoleglycerol-phosphate dehydratase HisB [Oscillospiraceae bacterium]